MVEEPLNNDRQQRERAGQHEVEDGAPLVLGDEHLAHLGPEVPRPVHTGMGSQGRHKAFASGDSLTCTRPRGHWGSWIPGEASDGGGTIMYAWNGAYQAVSTVVLQGTGPERNVSYRMLT